MARYLDGVNNELKITARSKGNIFSVTKMTNTVTRMPKMEIKEASVYPMEAPPHKDSTQSFNVNQFFKKILMLETKAKFNMSFLASPN